MSDDTSSLKGTDEILGDIERTRDSLTEKLGELESEVREMASEAKSTVWKAFAENLQKLSPSHLVRCHPWPFFGGAVGLGFVLAVALRRPAASPQALA